MTSNCWNHTELLSTSASICFKISNDTEPDVHSRLKTLIDQVVPRAVNIGVENLLNLADENDCIENVDEETLVSKILEVECGNVAMDVSSNVDDDIILLPLFNQQLFALELCKRISENYSTLGSFCRKVTALQRKVHHARSKSTQQATLSSFVQ